MVRKANRVENPHNSMMYRDLMKETSSSDDFRFITTFGQNLHSYPLALLVPLVKAPVSPAAPAAHWKSGFPAETSLLFPQRPQVSVLAAEEPLRSVHGIQVFQQSEASISLPEFYNSSLLQTSFFSF